MSGPLVTFPGAYKTSDAGIAFNLYGSPVYVLVLPRLESEELEIEANECRIPYPIPGPAVWTG